MSEIQRDARGCPYVICPHLTLKEGESVFDVKWPNAKIKLSGEWQSATYLVLCKSCEAVVQDQMIEWIYNRVKAKERMQVPCAHVDAYVARREAILHGTAVVGLVEVWHCNDCRSEYISLLTDEASMITAGVLSAPVSVKLTEDGRS